MENLQNKKVALISGCTGQDGSYLAELLLEKGYEVHGLVRRCSTSNFSRIEHIKDRLVIHYGDVTDPISMFNLVDRVRPDELYNLAAQSFVPVSWENPQYTMQATGASMINILEPIRQLGLQTKVYQASTSEMFSGDVAECPQNENTPKRPSNPYGIAKVFAYNTMLNYREAHKMFCANGILFNHESERRGEQFVTRKISLGIARIVNGLDDKIHLGNLDAMRDWGHAKDYVEAMWRILQQDKPDDFVIGTGVTRTVRELCEKAFSVVGLDWEKYVKVDNRFIRPKEVNKLIADVTKAKEVLGWQPTIGFDEMIERMVNNDILWIKKNK